MASDDEPPADPGASGSGPGFDTVSKVLMAGVATLVSAAATFGAVTGGVAFLIRNQASYMALALALATLAAVVAAAVVLWPTRIDRPWAIRAGAFLASGALLGGALLLVFATQAKLASAGSRPVIDAEWRGGGRVPTLLVTAKADGLTINDRLFANVLAYPRGQEAFLTYYSGFTGPDVNGHAEQQAAVPVPLSETELIQGRLTTVPIASVMVAAIVDKEASAPLIGPGKATGVNCEGEVYQSAAGKVSESDEVRRTSTKPACIYLRAIAPPGSSSVLSASADRLRVNVPGNVAWSDTGVYVHQRERLTVAATGAVRTSLEGPPIGPEGVTAPGETDVVVPDPGHYAALIGRIVGVDPGPPFLVGRNYQGTADRTGLLLLGVNDQQVGNNAGQFTAELRVEAG